MGWRNRAPQLPRTGLSLSREPIHLIDTAVSAWFHAHSAPVLTQVMLVVTNVHSTLGIGLMTAALALALLHRRQLWWLLELVLTVPGGMLLNVAMKQVFQRARPHFDNPLLTLASYSFPSGHAAGATLFYGFVVVLLLSQVCQRGWRIAIVAAAVLMVFLVCLSRVYLGVHYLSDVVGGVVEALLWLALCLSGVRAWRQRHRAGAL
jgi:membrane-associated phospholipid phosphatase